MTETRRQSADRASVLASVASNVDMMRDLARALDPTLIARDCGFELDEWQSQLMRSTAPRVLLLCARQTGKTTCTALIALATAVLQPGALVLIVSPSQRQSGEMFRVVLDLYRRLDGVPDLTAESALRATLANGSRIIALPGTEKTVRGYAAATLVIIDEASRVEDDLLQAVRPMLATTSAQGSRLIALTTPAGKRGWFYDAWTGDQSWHRVRVAATYCPRISQAFLDEELRELGAQRFSEEYGLEFLDPDTAVFLTAIIDAAFSSDVRPLWQ
jgi:terminase large subunit-like protein